MKKITLKPRKGVKSKQSLQKNTTSQGEDPLQTFNSKNLSNRFSQASPMSIEDRDYGLPCRIAKVISRAGLCSRREAERWILDGRVSLNGQRLTSAACVITKNDQVQVDGSPLPFAAPVQMWRYYKPKGLVTTHKDPQGRPTVFENLPAHFPRVISVGRLDFNTEGLLLLTNSGELARHFELPNSGFLRCYRVRARGRVTLDDLKRLKEGIVIGGIKYGPIEVSIDSLQGANTWLTIGLREGKNREIRKILSFLGLSVSRLIRISYGPFEVGDLAQGEAQIIPNRYLVDAIGSTLALKMGLFKSTQAAVRKFINKRKDKYTSRHERGK